ncbi:tetratricopeptide repeat protein [Rhodomicrobium sp. Az07]|uniref:tetratricopeptide repeat protein n=1 Tax=Rhodomicrobium sp. Az07 TaxID=2839034 RepID=UPI001BECEB4B|nr:tetratricopeptide repeat protein [Rhodomicrobium sp. Az07]MBT3070177.1 tetratricopeptide repeat protein [Rhodomicrobium sp. Az07]
MAFGITGQAMAAPDKSALKAQEGSSALLRGRYDLAVSAYDEALREAGLPPARQATILSDRGVAKWRLNQLDEAAADFTKAVSLNPDYALAYNNRGNVFLELNRPEEAFRDFDRAVALSPDFGAAYANRANASQKLNRPEAAEKDFRKAVELMPASSIPLNGCGRIAAGSGRLYTGLRYLNRAIALNAQFAPAYQNRAAIYAALKRNDEAARDLDKVIALAPDNAALYVARGQAHAKERRWTQAFRDFSKAVELAPDNVPALIGRASLNLERKRADLALEDLNHAISLDAKAADAWFWRGQAKYGTGDAEGADEDLSRAIELAPSHAEAYRYRGSYRERGGRRDEAIADYRKALEFDPLNRDLRDGYKTASGETADAVVKPLAPAVDGWEIFRSSPGYHIALNERYPKMPVMLETQGAAPPEILEWTLLKDTLAGIGLLRYRSGEKGALPHEYVAIIDLSRAQVAGIEPYITGDEKSKWAWTQYAVTVTDTDGLSSVYDLRKPRQEAPVAVRRDENPLSSVFGGGSGGRRGGPSILGWLFR